jgi:septum formation protein
MDESALPGESPKDLASRLAHGKAASLAPSNTGAVIIGSDQVAVCEGEAMGKPGSVKRATAQLSACSGKAADFYTAVCIYRPRDDKIWAHLDHTRVKFRKLSASEIDRYLALEPAIDCAGAFQAESLGITLFEYIHSRDPTALQGLPLIATSQMLREAGFQTP